MNCLRLVRWNRGGAGRLGVILLHGAGVVALLLFVFYLVIIHFKRIGK